MADIPVTRHIVITAESLAFATGPNGEVIVKLLGLEKMAGLTPGLGVMLGLTPEEARKFAQALIRTADAAEAKSR